MPYILVTEHGEIRILLIRKMVIFPSNGKCSVSCVCVSVCARAHACARVQMGASYQPSYPAVKPVNYHNDQHNKGCPQMK